MELKISDLPPQFENIAMKIGIYINKVLFEEYGGKSVYFPTAKMIYREARDREIVSEYNGFNPKKHDEEKMAKIAGDNLFLV